MKHNLFIDLDAMGLTKEQELRALKFFVKLAALAASDEGPKDATSGIALLVALVEFLAVGMREGFLSQDLSEERARLLIGTLTKLLPKSS